MENKTKFLLIVILCLLSVGCVPAETPSNKLPQNEQQEQQTEEKETAENESEQILKNCNLKGKWSQELTELMQQVNQEHQEIRKPEVNYGDFFSSRNVQQVEITGSASPYGDVTLEQLNQDTDYLFAKLKEGYGLYFYFGGDSVFNQAKEEIKKDCKEMPEVTFSAYKEILKKNLSLIQDLHFSIGKEKITPVTMPLFYTELELEKTDQGYRTADGKTVDSVDGYENLDELFKRSLTREGKIVYSPVTFEDILLGTDRNMQTKQKTLTIHYTNGESQQITSDPYQKAEKGEETFQLYEKDRIPVACLNQFGFDEGGDPSANAFLESAQQLKKQPVSIVDLRRNGGGNGALTYKWMKEYGREKVLSNFYQLSLWPIEEPVPNSRYYISKETQEELLGGKNIEGGSVSETEGDQFIENEEFLILLTGKNTASASECFCDIAHNLENTLIIGENTMGCFQGDSNGITLTLPYSFIPVNFGHSIHVFAENYFTEGYGFEPDLWCPAVYAEEAAINLIKNMMK